MTDKLTSPQDETYYNPFKATITNHRIDGIDLDIEESVDVSCAAQLLQRLHADFGPDFLLTMAPVASAMWPNGPGLSGFDYPTLDAQATEPTRPHGKLVNWYNAQFYNGWGDASTHDFYDNVIAKGGWQAERVVMGVLDCAADGGSGFVALDTLTSVIRQLRANYPSFGCAVGWEYWDAGKTDGYADPWRWVKEIGGVVFDNGTLPAPEIKADKLPNPPAPYQNSTDFLSEVGVGYLEAVRVLNETAGDLCAAEQDLGLVGLINEIGCGIIDFVNDFVR